MADVAHVGIGAGEKGENRKAGLGPLFGYATSIAVAVAFSAARGPRLPLGAAVAVLTASAMAASSGPMTALNVTDPRQWKAADWVTDLIPHRPVQQRVDHAVVHGGHVDRGAGGVELMSRVNPTVPVWPARGHRSGWPWASRAPNSGAE